MTAPQQINLIDLSLRTKRDWFTGRGIAAVTAGLATLVVAHGAFESTMLARSLVVASAAAPVANAPADGAPSADDAQMLDNQRLVARGERLMQAVSALSDLPHDNAPRLRALVSVMPESLWLQEVEFSGERGVRVAGGATDAAALARFAQRLGALPAFHGLPLLVFKVDPREAPRRQDTDASLAVDVRPAHYSFVLSTFDTDPVR